MGFPPGWTNPIVVLAGQVQRDVDPVRLLPARSDLLQWRLDQQVALLDSAMARYTPIQVTVEGVIWDGHHGVRAAAEKGLTVDVLVVSELVEPSGITILDLPVG
jgi:hypothetical protein